MTITPLQDDAGIWRKGATTNPELVDLIAQIKLWEVGKTFEVTFQKPFKTLGNALKGVPRQGFVTQVRKKDNTYTTWYVRVIPQVNKPLKKSKKRTGRKTAVNIPPPPTSAPS